MKAILDYWKERFQSLSAYFLIIGIIVGVFLLVRPKRQEPATSTTKTTVASGGVANITNINNPIQNLHQGVYGRVSSDRASIGVFKEVNSNIDVEVGGGKNYDDGEFAEVSVRYKF